MYAFMLLASEGGGQIEQIARTFGVDWTHLGSQVISFGVVCLVLYKFAYRSVLAMLDERRQQIALGIANAEKIKAELDRTEAQRQEVMARAYDESARVIGEAPAAAAPLYQQGNNKAMAAAAQTLRNANEP